MFSVSLSRMIQTIVEKTHQPGEYGRTQNGVLISCEVKVYDLGTEKSEWRFVHFAICGNKSVWMKIDKDRHGFIANEGWQNTCNHDSGWRHDGIEMPLNKLYFELCGKINPTIAPADMHQYNSFPYSNPWRLCQITWEPENSDNYRKRLVKLEVL